ncbi:MAG: ketopantoate reductase C-terminal domain-containing protein, partial [Caldisphaera sp.]|nr:ketopantoate reductase C-terminal domain-containing protein [Caldisphaera sp.]
KNNYFDQIIFATKAYDVKNAIEHLKDNNIDAETAISLQNGLGSAEELEKIYKNVAILIIYSGLQYLDKCKSIFHGGRSIIIGCKNNCMDKLNYWERVNNNFKIKIVENIEPYRWMKLAINSAINPLSVLIWNRNGKIIDKGEAFDLAINIVKETSYVAEKLNISLLEDPIKMLIDTIRETYNNCSSTLQDIYYGRKTELDYINLAIYNKAKEIGFEAKYNYFAYIAVNLISENIKKFDYPCKES